MQYGMQCLPEVIRVVWYGSEALIATIVVVLPTYDKVWSLLLTVTKMVGQTAFSGRCFSLKRLGVPWRQTTDTLFGTSTTTLVWCG